MKYKDETLVQNMDLCDKCREALFKKTRKPKTDTNLEKTTLIR